MLLCFSVLFLPNNLPVGAMWSSHLGRNQTWNSKNRSNLGLWLGSKMFPQTLTQWLSHLPWLCGRRKTAAWNEEIFSRKKEWEERKRGKNKWREMMEVGSGSAQRLSRIAAERGKARERRKRRSAGFLLFFAFFFPWGKTKKIFNLWAFAEPRATPLSSES